ncbi:hypothetical protein EXIGLDRAFT_734827 [Exidia glandulosa HHB12029]|uniref:Uncharacterized protein n=1 Tax=Exidia glandulosa HHB12029 TaxID=1314781 RepID=A0A165AZE7_EXIGL|nr:hypothetical protein EXIGLDRAFT_734827 [Exidia glandulosa HHB12029]
MLLRWAGSEAETTEEYDDGNTFDNEQSAGSEAETTEEGDDEKMVTVHGYLVLAFPSLPLSELRTRIRTG